MTKRALSGSASSRRAQRGYTVVEVLSAMTLFAIGAAGVISMQKVTIQGGDDARRFDIASNIANEWAFRLQRDAMFWTLPDAQNPGATSNLGTNTVWVNNVLTSNVWTQPPIPASGSEAGMSPAFDIFGRDLAAGSGDHIFCVQYRMNWVAAPAPPKLGAFMRAELRVVWARVNTPTINNCATLAATPDPDPTLYHFVYATTAIRSNAQ